MNFPWPFVTARCYRKIDFLLDSLDGVVLPEVFPGFHGLPQETADADVWAMGHVGIVCCQDNNVVFSGCRRMFIYDSMTMIILTYDYAILCYIMIYYDILWYIMIYYDIILKDIESLIHSITCYPCNNYLSHKILLLWWLASRLSQDPHGNRNGMISLNKSKTVWFGTMEFYDFPIILGMSSSQLTNSYFSEG